MKSNIRLSLCLLMPLCVFNNACTPRMSMGIINSLGDCVSGDCENGIGVHHTHFSDGVDVKYSGSFKDGKFNGQGEVVIKRLHNGDLEILSYVGEWKDNNYFGHGVLTLNTGAAFGAGPWKKEVTECESWHDTMPNGKCTKTWDDGTRYEGDMKNRNADGLGTCIWPAGNGDLSGSKYVGQWKNNLMHGHGVMTRPDGTTQAGIWKNGKFVGNVSN